MSNLIIIGNGFDLQCGLKTKYVDFLEYREKQLGPVAIDLALIFDSYKSMTTIDLLNRLKTINTMNDSILNFWDFLFLYYQHIGQRSNYDWFDIEKIIYDVVEYKDLASESNLTLQNLTRQIKTISQLKKTRGVFPNYTGIGINLLFALYIYSKITYQEDESDLNIQIEGIFEFGFQELEKFENAFLAYIKVIRTDSGYYQTARKILEFLNEGQSEYSLLNFNYTDPTLYARSVGIRDNLVRKENVHGSISKNAIIFGIDHKDIDKISLSYQFTKTARKIYSKNDLLESTDPKLLSDNCDRITIYGHSLNPADYSYYQSIFDFYNLYNSKITLVFCFSIYDKKSPSKIKRDNYNRVIRLILDYGETLDNVEHGKNLLHKLILENRILISTVSRSFK